jgi:hypothetical protein
MSPKQQRGAETADRLLAAALDEFTRHGAFTVQSIIGTSGVSLVERGALGRGEGYRQDLNRNFGLGGRAVCELRRP